VSEIAELAKAIFDGYAAMSPPHLPPDRWSALQVRLHRWEITTYGLATFDDVVHGVVEEWCRESNEAVGHEALVDAIADTMIFCIQACTHWRLDFGVIFGEARPRAARLSRDGAETSAAIGVGMLAEVARKTRQQFRGGWSNDRARAQVAEAVGRLVAGCAYHCEEDAYADTREPLDALIFRVAEHVMKRVNPARVEEVPR
jgi:hypothetical protein